MNLGLDMSLKLKQNLSFQMIQSLKLLQVNTLQLEQMLKTELEMNPVLEMQEDMELEQEEPEEKQEEEEETPAEEEELEVEEDEIDWEEYLEDGFDIGSRMSEETTGKEETYEPTPVYEANLQEHLENQLAERKVPEKVELLARFIIGSLSGDGFLRIDINDIAEFTKESIYDVEEALNVVWNMEPAGVGARTLQECLILQLRKRGMTDSLAMRILSEMWDLFERMKIPEIARQLNVDTSEVQAALNVVKTLNPKPGYLLNSNNAAAIIPDLIVEKVDGEFIAILNDRSVPMLHINKAYADMIRRGSKVNAEIKKYVREKLNNATWLIRSIEQRKSTMLKVMYSIIKHQKQFFENGPPNLNPLKLQDIADDIEMHISTVSRVTNGKYVQTMHGIFELKHFFTEAMGTDAQGVDVSAERIKNRIKELVEKENPKKPLSDQKISDMLKREDLKVARRTVAKYREQMRILPARLRQKYD
ncbi:MAG: RNA polymerase factor sigma-54 [Chitinivibrionales bacterium]|nr:RNA polymerase factor sigma-54 [Chitinivibrionales bacterium]